MTLLLLSGAWALGIYLGARLDLPLSAVALFLLAASLFTLLFRTAGRSLLPGLILAVFLLGVVRVEGLASGDVETPIGAYHGQGALQVRGLVSSDPEAVGSATRLRLEVDAVNRHGEWNGASGDVLVTLRESSDLAEERDRPYFRYGDLLLLEGRLDEPVPFEGFDYPAYLARQGITTVMLYPQATLLAEGKGMPFYRWLYSARQGIAGSLERGIPEPQASVSQALLLGLRKNLPQQIVQDFNATGTSHLLAISGLHVGVLLGVALVISEAALGRRRRLYLLPPLLLVWLYAMTAGLPPSMARAAIMASVLLFGRYLGRPGSIFPALGAAAALMVGLNPNILWSISFQLSFTAIAGIALLGQPMRRWLGGAVERLRAEGWLSTTLVAASGVVAITLAATIATLPLVAFYFHRISLAGVPATLLTLPAMPAVLSAGALAGLVGLASPLLAQPLGWVAWAFTAYLTGAVRLFSMVPGASIQVGHMGPFLVWAYYGALMLLLLGVRLKHLPGRLRAGLSFEVGGFFKRASLAWWALVPLMAVATLFWVAALSLPDSRLRVTFLDVGQGDSILVVAPGRQQILIDGGPHPLEAVRALGEVAPFWDRSLDLVVLTHPHEDHITGLLEVLRRYKVEHILERGVSHELPGYSAWRRLIKEKQIPVTQAQEGQVVALKGGGFIQVLGPPADLLEGSTSDVDNNSVVLRLVYGGVSFLLTGDIHAEAEGAILSGGHDIDSTVLKVAHQGSRTSSSSAFLRKVSPAVAVISVGADNRFGHPHPETLRSLAQYVAPEHLWLTAESGSIEFTTDGNDLTVVAER